MLRTQENQIQSLLKIYQICSHCSQVMAFLNDSRQHKYFSLQQRNAVNYRRTFLLIYLTMERSLSSNIISLNISCNFLNGRNMYGAGFEPWMAWLKIPMLCQVSYFKLIWRIEFIQLTLLITPSGLIYEST